MLNPDSRLGPVLLGTVICRDLATSQAAYCNWLGQLTLQQGRLSTAQALALKSPNLIQARVALIGPARTELPWLRLIEDPDAHFGAPFSRAGWMSLEVAVRDVDALAAQLKGSLFTVLAEPNDLEMSAHIRAMQVAGPSGEVLYLTQIKAAVPPFQLPRARHFVDRLFIPVLGAPDRDRALRVYELIAQRRGLSFETRLSAFNRCNGLPSAQRHPVGVLQLRQASMIEIDQLPAAMAPNALNGTRLPGGIASVMFKVPAIHPLLNGATQRFLHGAAGEGIELTATLDWLRNH